MQIFWFLLLSNTFIFVYPFNYTVHHFKINILTCHLLGCVSAQRPALLLFIAVQKFLVSLKLSTLQLCMVKMSCQVLFFFFIKMCQLLDSLGMAGTYYIVTPSLFPFNTVEYRTVHILMYYQFLLFLAYIIFWIVNVLGHKPYPFKNYAYIYVCMYTYV